MKAKNLQRKEVSLNIDDQKTILEATGGLFKKEMKDPAGPEAMQMEVKVIEELRRPTRSRPLASDTSSEQTEEEEPFKGEKDLALEETLR